MKKIKIWHNRILWTGILFALALVCSAVKLVVLPQGGCATYFSLLVLWLISYFYGWKYGTVCSVIFGIARFLVIGESGRDIVSYPQLALLLEYPLAHGVFGLGALLKGPQALRNAGREEEELHLEEQLGYTALEAWKLRAGYVVGVLAQLVLYVIAAMICYPWERDSFWSNLWYSIVYDGSYLLIEGGITFILLCIPPIVMAITYLKYVATHDEKNDTLECF